MTTKRFILMLLVMLGSVTGAWAQNLHTHQFDGNGVCTVEDCGYDAKALVNFIDEVYDEGIFGDENESTNRFDIHNLFDGDRSTNWTPRSGMHPNHITVTAFFQTLQPVVINGYSFYCEKEGSPSNDCVPMSWNLYGYNITNQRWELLDAVENNSATAYQYNNYRFNNEEGKSYQYFKWEVTKSDWSNAQGPFYNIKIGEFTLDIVNTQHAHSYSEYWSSDDTGHWHQCLVPFGECDAPKNDFTAHTHTAYSEKCDVCKHINAHEHEWDENMNCRLCGPHTHQFDGNGVCTVENCGYNAKELVGSITEVADEGMLGDSRSTDKNMIKYLFDGDISTKWINWTTRWDSMEPTAIFQTLQPVAINGYSFYCDRFVYFDNDEDYQLACLPKSWNLYGYNMATQSWELLDVENNQEVAENHYNNYRFKNEGDKSYQYFKWEVNDINYKGATSPFSLSIGEFSLDFLQHTHNYSEDFHYDETNHWHQCLSTIAVCDASEIDLAAHTYTTYEKKCDVCDYTINHEHEWDVDYGTCRLCGTPHTHVFDSNGVCIVENCGYDANVNAGFMTEVEDEAIFGDCQSTNKAAIKNLFDRDSDTKWTGNVCLRRGFKSTVIFKTQEAAIINGYSMCTYEVYPSLEYRPQDWTLYGYDEASSEWKVIHNVTDASPVDGWNNYRFANSEGASYSYFKLEITKLQQEHDAYKANIVELALDVQHEHIYTNHICIVCGHVGHIHRYSEEWSSDATGHWHQCLSIVGECDEPKEDFAEHIHTIYEKKCDVCGYINAHEHEWDVNVEHCLLCGAQHIHQFDGNGKCQTSGCEYSVSDTNGFLLGVNETIGGSTPTGDFENLFDGNNDTKWTAKATAVAIFKTLSPTFMNGYSFTSDDHERQVGHPKSWKLYGLNESTDTWEEMHSVTNASVGNGWNNYRFTINSRTLYSYYKLEVTGINPSSYHNPSLSMGEFTVDILDAQHVHKYSEDWYSDDTGHWHQCLIKVGECDVHKKDYAEHPHTIYSAKCDVCGYINAHEHEWDVNVEHCLLCEAQHIHQFDGNGVCTTANCGYNAKDLAGLIDEVEDESIFGGSQSTNKTEIRNLFDGDISTKWQPYIGGAPTDLHTVTAIFKTLQPVVMTGYSFYCEKYNTYFYRNTCLPKSWNLYGYNTATNNWDLLDAINDQEAKANCYNSYRFKNEGGQSYQYFKWEVTSTTFADFPIHLEISEFALDIHNHNYEWRSDETGHWLVCVNEEGTCNMKKKNEGAHSYDDTAERGTEPYYKCVCGYIDPVRQHVHNYVGVIVDEHYHKQVCTSEIGYCTAKVINDTEHIYHESSLNGEAYYTCSVCNYVNETRKSAYDARDYMSMTAVGGDVTVGSDPYENPSYVLQYSSDKTHWTEYAVINNGPIVTIHEGETYYFRTASPTVQTSVIDIRPGHPTIPQEVWSFTMEGTGTIEAGGNIMSLLDQTCQSLTVGDWCFEYLFVDCVNLTVAPKLPATTLGELCYTGMFSGCTNLQKAPHLPASSLPLGCYTEMFKDCASLNYVEADFTETTTTNRYNQYRPEATNFKQNTEDWLDGTAAEGILVLKREMIEKQTTILNNYVDMPNGWRNALKIRANEDPDHSGKFYTTYYDNCEYYITDEFKAYTGSIVSGDDGDELHLTQLEDGIIPYNTGVVICSDTPDVVLPRKSTSVLPLEGNALTGSNTDIAAPANCYILSYGQNGLGFYRYAEGKTLSAHKAYLTYQHGSAQARALRMVFADEEVDGIESINDDDTLRYDDDNIYSVSGVRLNKLQKGINIVNGKKVVIK